jgi:hypothetical protein
MKRHIGMLAIVTVLAACSQSENTAVQPASQPQQGGFALQSQSTGGEARVTLHASAAAGTIVTLIGQLNYDTSRLTMRSCEIGNQIGAGTAAGKTLHFKEPAPGVVRAVVEGGLQALPSDADVLACTFAAAPGAPSDPATVLAQGNVSDTSFKDRPFVAEAKVSVGK